ncbi:ATP phosphoribosyltransferase regulatory subunit [Pannus brasiliensis CCIBt3594]|uniref:ATP phosphoribosyltransferase regulatory subunit n=1 Tax=Pannus brasiliensis CCIBt3594 TaxID=1427578 RepID=A0AAW9QQE4_9CHRO
MIHQPPAGARDLLPLEVTQKGWINDRLQQVFQGWGYQRVVSPTIEWLDTLVAGGTIDPATVIQLQNTGSGALGLRPELTASIARAAVTRMSDRSYPQRICYRANVFRRPPAGYHGRPMEFYQAGVELLFAGGLLADAEILLLLADCFDTLGLENWQMILGEAGLTRSLLSPFPEPLRERVRHCLALLDRVTLENLPYPDEELRQRALLLFHLRGKPAEVLAKVAPLAREESDRTAIANLESLMELLEKSRSRPFPLVLDLSLVQTFDYYTGIVFKAVSSGDGRPRVLGQGGRYDRLLGVYHPRGESAPGIGFSLNIEDLHESLLSGTTLPEQAPAIDWLVIPVTELARNAVFVKAQIFRDRETNSRVAIDLGGGSPDEIRDRARDRGIRGLAWVREDGSIEEEFLDS